MDKMLTKLRRQVLEHLSCDPLRPPLNGVGVFHCRLPQALRNVPIHQPIAILVVSGYKIVALGERRIEITPGELLLLPSGCTIEIGNHPSHRGEDYLALAIAFPEESLSLFRRSYGPDISVDMLPLWNAPATNNIVSAVAQWVEWCMLHSVDPIHARHRHAEILLLLANAGIAGNLLLNRDARWRDRVAQLLSLDPARDWSASDVCRRLGIGESTLRRRLHTEGSSFRQVLEESRMLTALALLQETFWPVGQVAEAVGYSSHSRFSERFKRRFGLLPAELKKSRTSKGEQKASD